MKAVLTLISIVVFGALAIAQNVPTDAKVALPEMAVVLVSSAGDSILVKEDTKVGTQQIARLYKRKNSRVNKALKFTTKKDRPKLA